MRDHELFSVKTIPGEYKKLFGRDVDIFDVIELLPIVLRQTHTVPPEYIFINDTIKDFKIITPCVYYSVKFATVPMDRYCTSLQDMLTLGQGILWNYNLAEWQNTMAVANGDVVINQVASPAILLNSNFPMKPTGNFIDFQARGNVLTFPVTNIPVNILLTVTPVDKEGYPLITEQIITAMAYFMNLIFVQKKYYSQQMPKYVFDDAKKDYEYHLSEALSPQCMSDNEINDIMNALASFDRHTVNQPFRY